MKKMFAVMMCVLFGAAMLAGCAPKQEAEQTEAPAVEEATPAIEGTPAVEGTPVAPAEQAPAEE